MLNTSQLYKDLFNEGAVQEYKVIINDTEYIGQIFGQPTLSQRLFDKETLTVGSFTSAVFKAKLSVASETIPRNANVEFQYRYTDGTRNSEWITKFKGKVTNRIKESEDVTSIEAKDKAVNYDVFLDYFNEAIAAYPANTRVVANLCASHLGLVIENIEDVIDMNVVEYPNEMTIVEVLKNIAALSGGNWTITENETLKLVVGNGLLVGSYPVQKYQTHELLSPLSKVTMYYADDKAFSSGDDSGSELIIDSLWATQSTAHHAFNLLNGFEYTPIKSSGVYADTAIQLGDVIEVNDSKQTVVNIDWTFDGKGIANIETPQNNEENYDDPYNTLVQNQFKRKVSLGNSYQGVTIDRESGLQMLYSPDGTEANATGKYYADLDKGMAFQYRDTPLDEWNDWLYFDKNEKVFKLALYSTTEEDDRRFSAIEVDIEGIETIVARQSEDISGNKSNHSLLKQTVEDFEFTVSHSNGLNLLRNSLMFNENEFWNSKEDDTLGGLSGQVNTWALSQSSRQAIYGNGKDEQSIQVQPNVNYALSFTFNKQTASGIIRVYYRVNDNEIDLFTRTAQGVGEYSSLLHFETTTDLTIGIEMVGINMDNPSYIANLIVTKGEIYEWSPAIGETYTQRVLIDGSGVRVISNDNNAYTSMTPYEFAHYYNDVKVFEMDRLLARFQGVIVEGETFELKGALKFLNDRDNQRLVLINLFDTN